MLILEGNRAFQLPLLPDSDGKFRGMIRSLLSMGAFSLSAFRGASAGRICCLLLPVCSEKNRDICQKAAEIA